MRKPLDILWFHTWWSYAPSETPLHSIPYHFLNLVEAACWLTFAGLVLRRYARHRRSSLELAYALAFFTFGLTDLREAWALQSWLIWLKLLNLVILAWLRRRVMREWHPEAKVY